LARKLGPFRTRLAAAWPTARRLSPEGENDEDDNNDYDNCPYTKKHDQFLLYRAG
jgi:hypothetical protein